MLKSWFSSSSAPTADEADGVDAPEAAGLSNTTIGLVTAGSAVAAAVAIPFVLPVLGFTAAGVAAGDSFTHPHTYTPTHLHTHTLKHSHTYAPTQPPLSVLQVLWPRPPRRLPLQPAVGSPWHKVLVLAGRPL